MPDEKGNFKGIAIPALPWKETDDEATEPTADSPGEWPYDQDDLQADQQRGAASQPPRGAPPHPGGRLPRMAGAPKRQTIAVDFDGVIHAYSQGWQGGGIYDLPNPGTRDALIGLSSRYRLIVFTARENLADVANWLMLHDLRHFFASITNRKPMAHVYLDDRAMKFESWDQALKELT